MKYNPLLAEMILEESKSQNKENLKASETYDASKSWLERFFEFLTPSNIYIATK